MSRSLDKPRVTVVMSAHNADSRIGRAVESLQRQTFENFELIVIDDGSKDRTGDIVNRIADRDIRVTLCSINCVGANKARDIALSRARGTYVMYMRAQDWLEPQALSDLVSAADSNRLELAVSGFVVDAYYGKNNDHISETHACRARVYPTQTDFRTAAWQLFDAGQLCFACGKLYLRELVERLRIRFDSPVGGDLSFVLSYIRDVERVGVVPCPSYHFVCLGGNGQELITGLAGSGALADESGEHFDLWEHSEAEYTLMADLYRYWGLDGDSPSTEMLQRHYMERLFACIQSICDPTAGLSSAELRGRVGAMITSERVQRAVQVARPQTVVMALLFAAVRSRNVGLVVAEGRLFSYIARHDSRAFVTLTSSRASAGALSY